MLWVTSIEACTAVGPKFSLREEACGWQVTLSDPMWVLGPGALRLGERGKSASRYPFTIFFTILCTKQHSFMRGSAFSFSGDQSANHQSREKNRDFRVCVFLYIFVLITTLTDSKPASQ